MRDTLGNCVWYVSRKKNLNFLCCDLKMTRQIFKPSKGIYLAFVFCSMLITTTVLAGYVYFGVCSFYKKFDLYQRRMIRLNELAYQALLKTSNGILQFLSFDW